MRKSVKLMIAAIAVGSALVASPIFATTYILHIAGMCSTQWVGGNDGRLANAPGMTSIDAKINTTVSIPNAASQIKSKFDQY